jgi:glucokinase
MQAFTGKGRMQALLESMPVRVITNDRIALLGAARCALVKTAAGVN